MSMEITMVSSLIDELPFYLHIYQISLQHVFKDKLTSTYLKTNSFFIRIFLRIEYEYLYSDEKAICFVTCYSLYKWEKNILINFFYDYNDKVILTFIN